MSTLNVSNITDGTTTVGTGYVVNGSAKAWNNTNSGGGIINNSFNISSLTDVGTGIQQHNVTSNFSTDNNIPVFSIDNNVNQTWTQSLNVAFWQTRCYTGSAYVDAAVRTSSDGDLA